MEHNPENLEVGRNTDCGAGVSEDNRDKVRHPGEQAVTSTSLEPLSVRDDISWSRNRDRLLKQLDALRASLDKLHLPDLRYNSRLIGRLPVSTAFLVSIPNLAQYLGEVQTTLQQNTWWSGSGLKVDPLIEKLRAASVYLGDEIIITGFAGPDGKLLGPVVSIGDIDFGVRVRFAKGTRTDAVFAHMQCHLAYAERNGFDKAAAGCPLYIRGVSFRRVEDGQSIDILGPNPKVVADIRRLSRAEAVVIHNHKK